MGVKILVRSNRFYNSKGGRDKQSGTIENYMIKGVNNILDHCMVQCVLNS